MAAKLDRVFDLLMDKSGGVPLILNLRVVRNLSVAVACLLVASLTVFIARTYWQGAEDGFSQVAVLSTHARCRWYKKLSAVTSRLHRPEFSNLREMPHQFGIEPRGRICHDAGDRDYGAHDEIVLSDHHGARALRCRSESAQQTPSDERYSHMRAHGQTKLGFYPLRPAEVNRLKDWLNFQEPFSALDPCVGDGVAFAHLVRGTTARRYGIEIDAYRAEQARSLGIETLQANVMDVRCQAETASLLYLNPPYDWEAGSSNNQRLESVFLEHSYRWLKPGGVLIFVIPQLRLGKCARLLSEEFQELRVYRLTEPACAQYKQIVVLGTRRKRHTRLADSALLDQVRWLEGLATRTYLEPPAENPEILYEVPGSGPLVLTHVGIPLDEVEDLLLDSAAYRQASRILLPKQRDVRGRPLTPLHGGHVGLLCTAGLLNGVFGEGKDRHIAHWRSVKFTDHWEEEEEDGTKILHDRERFSHELTLVFSNGKTQVLTHEKKGARDELRMPGSGSCTTPPRRT